MQVQTIEKNIARTLQQLAATGAVLKGSVNKVILGRKIRSRGDRVAYLLTYKGENNTTQSLYIRKDQLAEVKQMIRNYGKLKEAVGCLLDLNIQRFKARRVSEKQPTTSSKLPS